jgi:predicted NUDIX family NTP pyrophosphohydrolase
MYRRAGKTVEVLLVHPGGPFWRNKDAGAWSIPKGEIEPGEDPVEVARREFQEELGTAAGQPLRALGEIRQRGGKRVIAFASKEIWMLTRLRATLSKWNGPRKVGGDRAFRRSIALHGST